MPTESESQVGRDVRLTLIDREKGREGAGRGEKSEPRPDCLVIMSDDDQKRESAGQEKAPMSYHRLSFGAIASFAPRITP